MSYDIRLHRSLKVKIIQIYVKLVVQSIKLYRYPFGVPEETILEKLNQKKKFDLTKIKLVKRQGENLERLDLIKIEETSHGIHGHMRLWTQQKDNKFSEDTHPEPADVTFTISRSKKLLVIHGSAERDTFVKIISVLIHDEQDGYFIPFNIPKDKIVKLQTKLLGSHTKNCVEDARFDTTTNRYRNRSRQGFEKSPTSCATEDSEYAKILADCDNTYPIIRLIQCRGLLDDEANDFKTLEINENAEFRFYQNISSEAWDDFFFNVCQPILGVTMMN